jgi:hypothetical protein
MPILYYNNQPTVDIIYYLKHYLKAKYINIYYFYVQNDIVKAGRL